MKRFITDVHTVWLTNLSHHPEFRRMVRGDAANQEHGGVSGGDSSGGNGRGDRADNATPGTTSRRGLEGGRDSAAIAASQSQIQSVQPELAFRAAFFYSSDSKDSSSSQLATENTRREDGQRGGQLAEHTALSYGGPDDNEGGNPPELPPPPFTAPRLAVLVAERRQFAALSASGPGGTRRSFGGAPKRRSVAGGAGSGDVGSWLDMSTRVLRVFRFSPPPPVTAQQAPENASTHVEGAGDAAAAPGDGFTTTAGEAAKQKIDEEAEGTPLSPSGVGEVLESSPGATWMISSFHPYDGTETRVTIADGAVTKVVGEALSVSGPLAMAESRVSLPGAAGTALAPSKAGGARAGAGAGGPAVSSGIDSLALSGREGCGRVLVLRRGVRVPVLGEGGGIVGRVLSVVEVRTLSLTMNKCALRKQLPYIVTICRLCRDQQSLLGSVYLFFMDNESHARAVCASLTRAPRARNNFIVFSARFDSSPRKTHVQTCFRVLSGWTKNLRFLRRRRHRPAPLHRRPRQGGLGCRPRPHEGVAAAAATEAKPKTQKE